MRWMFVMVVMGAAACTGNSSSTNEGSSSSSSSGAVGTQSSSSTITGGSSAGSVMSGSSSAHLPSSSVSSATSGISAGSSSTGSASSTMANGCGTNRTTATAQSITLGQSVAAHVCGSDDAHDEFFFTPTGSFTMGDSFTLQTQDLDAATARDVDFIVFALDGQGMAQEICRAEEVGPVNETCTGTLQTTGATVYVVAQPYTGPGEPDVDQAFHFTLTRTAAGG